MDLSRDEIAAIIERARVFAAKVEGVDHETGSESGDESDADVLEESPDDAVRDELFEEIEGLNEDQQVQLTALMWVGRGDYDASEFAEAAAEARRAKTTPTGDYLLGSPTLADDLEAGLEAVAALEDETQD